MITNQADLATALLLGGDIACDPAVSIALTAPMAVTVPARLLGGTFTVASGPAFIVTSGNVEVAGLSVIGPGGLTLDTTQKLIYVLGTQTAPLVGIDVHDCRLTGSACDSAWLEWCVDSSVHDCQISDFLNSGVMVVSGDSVTVEGNAIRDGHIATGAVEVYGIAFTDLLNTTAARSRYCTAADNHVSEVDWEGIDTHGGLGIVITGNTVTACRRSIALVTGNSTRVTAPQNCAVSGNVVDATGARVTPDIGIFLAGASGLPASATIGVNEIVGYDGTGQAPITTTNWARGDTVVGSNSRAAVPWTNVPLTGGWTLNATFPAQYQVDGNTVSFNGGGVVPPSGGDSGHPQIGTLTNAAAWPARRSFASLTKGSSATASIGVLDIDTDGTLRVDYDAGTDQFTRWLTGSYQAV